MNDPLPERQLGISIDNITPELLRQLPSPYNIVARWLRYVPLTALMECTFAAVSFGHENDDDTVTLNWYNVPSVHRRITIPLDLYRDTNDYIDYRLRHRWGYCFELFATEDGPLTPSTYFEACLAAMSRVI